MQNRTRLAWVQPPRLLPTAKGAQASEAQVTGHPPGTKLSTSMEVA